MAGMFFTMQEVTAKLGKSEDDIKQLVATGKLREFRDGAKILFKSAEVNALAPASPSAPAIDTTDGSSIGLTPLDDTTSAPGAPAPVMDLGAEEFDLSKEDTQLTGQGLSILSETDSEFQLTDDTMAKTHAAAASTGAEPSLEKIEDDVNLDSFGSGSGLLDLSLQADDTSLGGVLDEIYPGSDLPAAPEAQAVAAEPTEVAAEAEQIFTETETAQPAAAVMAAYAEPEPDASSNFLGLMLLVPLIAIIYTIVVMAGQMSNVVPTILTAVQDIFWYIIIGAAVLALIIAVIGVFAGGKPKPPKAVKA
jgi:hypothetical protein